MWTGEPTRGWIAARWFGILALACAIFAWGVQYKLSLYDAHPSNSMPAAKLVTGKGDAQSQIEQAAQKQIKPVFSKLQLDLLILLCGLSLLGLHVFLFPRSIQISLRPQRVSLNHFAFRPPPFLS